ncbi:NEP1-interacting protein [Salix suchowensis]|nr:NEP1-interacting protein [Salix suchowensis]
MMKIVYKCPLSCAAASSAAASFAFLVSSTVSAIACKLFFGTILGAYCGAMVGLKSKSSFLHGAKVGAIMGCVLSIEFCRKAFSLWDSDDCAIGIFIHLAEERTEKISAGKI